MGETTLFITKAQLRCCNGLNGVENLLRANMWNKAYRNYTKYTLVM